MGLDVHTWIPIYKMCGVRYADLDSAHAVLTLTYTAHIFNLSLLFDPLLSFYQDEQRDRDLWAEYA